VGRGSGIAHAGVFWHPDDFRLLEWMIQRSSRKRAEAEAILTLLERPGCRVVAFDDYFSEVKNTANSPVFSANCGRCDRCTAMSLLKFEASH
jgi:superfamily II DNA helicase RecQ